MPCVAFLCRRATRTRLTENRAVTPDLKHGKISVLFLCRISWRSIRKCCFSLLQSYIVLISSRKKGVLIEGWSIPLYADRQSRSGVWKGVTWILFVLPVGVDERLYSVVSAIYGVLLSCYNRCYLSVMTNEKRNFEKIWKEQNLYGKI